MLQLGDTKLYSVRIIIITIFFGYKWSAAIIRQIARMQKGVQFTNACQVEISDFKCPCKAYPNPLPCLCILSVGLDDGWSFLAETYIILSDYSFQGETHLCYTRIESVPRSKHFTPWLYKTNLLILHKEKKLLFVLGSVQNT